MARERSAPVKLSRRRFLLFAGAASGAAGLSLAGCGGGSSTPTPAAPPSPSPQPTPSPAATPQATPTFDPSQPYGSTLRYSGFVVSGGTFDPHRTRSGPLLGLHSMVYSRLLTYSDQAEGLLEPDLAQELPEQPDAQQYIFRLRPDARWHDDAATGGRPVTSADVRYSIERQAQGDTSFVRRSQWALVDEIETPDDRTVILRMAQPYADLPNITADAWASIVAPDVVESGDAFTASRQIGSGPFRWIEWEEGNFASVSRNPDWYGEEDLPFLDGVVLSHATSTDEVEGALRTRNLDMANVGRVQADRLRGSLPELQEQAIGQSLFFGMRFLTAAPPYSDIRLRNAIAIALNREAMIERFFGGSGVVNPWISASVSRWALPHAELTAIPGHRAGSGGRAEDIAEAMALADAMRSEGSLPDTLELLVTSDVEASIGMGTTIAAQLRDSLGLEVAVTPVEITDLFQRLIDGQAPWAAGLDGGWLALDDWVYPHFHSAGNSNTFPIRDPDLDALLEAQRAEMDEPARRGYAHEIQRRLLSLNAGVNLVSERAVSVGWPYVRGFPMDIADGHHDRLARTWIDRGDISYSRRGSG